MTKLHWKVSDGPPFRVTDREVTNVRIIEVPSTAVMLALWDETQGHQTSGPFYAVSLDGNSVSLVTETSYLLNTRYQIFDPAIGSPAMDESLVAPAESDIYIVQFLTQPLPKFAAALDRIGAAIHAFLPNHAYIMKMSEAAHKEVASLPFVRAVVPFHPAYKLEEDIHRQLTSGAQSTEVGLYSVMLWARGHAVQQRVAERITELGGCVRRIVPEQHHFNATLTLDQVREIAKLSDVAFVDVPGDAGSDVDNARIVSGADYLEFQTVEGFNGGIRNSCVESPGDCVWGEVMDGGLIITPLHMDFQNHLPIFHGSNGTSDPRHGTKVFGLVFGDGSCQAIGRGILPNGQGIVAARDPFDDPPTDDCGTPLQGGRYAHVAELVDPNGPYRAVFQTNSWGHAHKTAYTIISAEFDDIAFTHKIAICQSLGNISNLSQYTYPPYPVRPEAWAKNVLTVGGFKHKDNASHADDDWCAQLGTCRGAVVCASGGPAADGRVKPDLVHFADCAVRAPSDNYTACMPGCTTCYENFAGTSAATPMTCGYAGLVFQMWHESVFKVWNGTTSVPTGGGASVFADRPHAATVKALLINTAYRYPLVTEPPLYRPDFTRDNMGWGIVDAAALYEQRNNMFIVNETDLLPLFGTRTYTYTVPTGSPALRVTMVYADPPGIPNSTSNLVNDLSVKVISPSGTLCWGNFGLVSCPIPGACLDDFFVGNWSVPASSTLAKDHKNNVENVFIKNPQPGTWTITVSADSIVQDGHVETPLLDADYALVVSSGDRPRGRCCQTVCTPSYHCTCSWTSRSACTGPGAVWVSDATCADDCTNVCFDVCPA
jgi:hypothetical protein